MNLGDLATVAQGEVRVLALNFASLLASNETLVGPPTAKMQLWSYSAAPDANAQNLVLGSPWLSGSNVLVVCGGYGTDGFQADAAYSLWGTCATSAGQTLEAYGQITCDSMVPPTQSSGGALPSAGEPIAITVNTTASEIGPYAFAAAGLTFSLPSSWASAGPLTITDAAQWGGTVAGNVLNWPSGTTSMALVPGGSMTFIFSAQLNGWLSI